MGTVYWEREVVETNQSKTSIYFMENLKLFVENHKDIKFYNVFAKKSSGNLLYLEATNKDKTIIYRQIEGINSKEDLIEWREILSTGRKRKLTYYQMKYNLPKLAFNWLKYKFSYIKEIEVWNKDKGIFEKKNRRQTYLTPPYKELCSDNEDLYKGFSNSYFNGYSFNCTSEDKVYTDVYNFDYKNNHSSIMYYEKFPKNFSEINPSKFSSICNKSHFYGEFKLIVKNEDPYLYKMNGAYNGITKTLYGYFNDIDFKFISLLCGIEKVKCERLWVVEVEELSSTLRKTIETVYKWTQLQKKGTKERQLLKWCNEKLYGEAAKKRFYPTSYKWNEEEQKLEEIVNEFKWEEVSSNLRCHYDYSIAVWTCSYARFRLLKLRRKLEQIGCEVLYGDIDSIKFRGEQGLTYINEINKGIPNDFTLGKLELEDFATKLRVLSFKWYCYQTEEKLVVKAAGANIEVVQKWLETLPNPVESFTKDFPIGVNPYKRIRKINDGYEVYWTGSTLEDQTLTSDKTLIVSCAGSGKTTTLVERVKEKHKEFPNDRIVVIAFTNKNVEDLRAKLHINIGDKIEVRTLDSLAASYLNGAVEGDNFEKKLQVATELLTTNPELSLPCHLFVDEFQDLDYLKFNFICSIPCISRFYIGDPNQSIYGYSGAANLFNRLSGFKIERRNTNYRCPQNINDFGEGFLSEENRPKAISNLPYKGVIEKKTIEELSEVNCTILCRTNEQVKRVKERYPFKDVLTIHKAKGLSFDCVAVVGIENLKENSEEQNIAYVACTRARQNLIIVKEGN